MPDIATIYGCPRCGYSFKTPGICSNCGGKLEARQVVEDAQTAPPVLTLRHGGKWPKGGRYTPEGINPG